MPLCIGRVLLAKWGSARAYSLGAFGVFHGVASGGRQGGVHWGRGSRRHVLGRDAEAQMSELWNVSVLVLLVDGAPKELH